MQFHRNSFQSSQIPGWNSLPLCYQFRMEDVQKTSSKHFHWNFISCWFPRSVPVHSRLLIQYYKLFLLPPKCNNYQLNQAYFQFSTWHSVVVLRPRLVLVPPQFQFLPLTPVGDSQLFAAPHSDSSQVYLRSLSISPVKCFSPLKLGCSDRRWRTSDTLNSTQGQRDYPHQIAFWQSVTTSMSVWKCSVVGLCPR